MSLDSHFTSYTKNNSKWNMVPNIKVKTINIPEENRRKFCDPD